MALRAKIYSIPNCYSKATIVSFKPIGCAQHSYNITLMESLTYQPRSITYLYTTIVYYYCIPLIYTILRQRFLNAPS